MPDSTRAHDLLESASDAVTMAKRAGADDVWAGVSRSRSVSFTYRDGTLEKVEDSTSRGLSLRLYVDGRYSSHGTTDLQPERLQAFVREAVAVTRALQPDPHREITDPELFANRPDDELERVDPAIAALDRDRREAWCKAMDELAHADERVISAECGVFSGHSESASASSNGFSGTAEGDYAGYSTQVTVREDADKRPEGSYYAVGRFLGDLPGPESIAKEALKRALDRIGSRKGPTTRTTLVVDNQSASSLLWRALGPASAAAIQQGRSFWAGKQGKQLFSKKLTVIDDPLLPRGLSSRHYDGEGISARRLPIIEKGVVKNFYVDTYYGKKAGLTPTTGSPSNRVVALGSKSLDQILKAVGDGIYVMSWMGGNSDSTTGDFSLGLRGFEIKNGKLGAPVGEMNVTGNLADLWQRLELVGNDPHPFSSLKTPTLAFADVQFSGS
ncbi:MAG: TldD/PmbA family protein [Myxococcales bacterium]|nr:TldD/PmbA family protein [Myxococcales bacterium]